MVTLRVTYTDANGKDGNEFLGETREDALDVFLMWISNEVIDYRYPADAMQELLTMHSFLRLGGKDWDTLFEFIGDGNGNRY